MPKVKATIVTEGPRAWDGGKATENLISNDGDLVFIRLAAADRRPRIRLLGLMSWDRPRTTTAQAVQRTTTTAFRMTASLCCFTRPSRAISF